VSARDAERVREWAAYFRSTGDQSYVTSEEARDLATLLDRLAALAAPEAAGLEQMARETAFEMEHSGGLPWDERRAARARCILAALERAHALGRAQAIRQRDEAVRLLLRANDEIDPYWFEDKLDGREYVRARDALFAEIDKEQG
jgi:hypothetical protein